MKRFFALMLAAALILPAAGCAAIFEKEVYSEELYEAPSEYAEPDDAADTISNYAALRRAITRLVSEHAESAELQFQNYDGSISQDISTACWEVKSSTALGAFAVDYISYDLSRIVSYYQAEIYITYKRSEYQVSAVERAENLPAMRARLEDALRAGETYVVLELTAASLTGDAVAQSVEQAYYADPLASPVLPAVEAAVYPETGVERIVEVTLDYGLDSEGLSLRREELAAGLDGMVAACLAPEDGPETEEEPQAEPGDGEPERPPEELIRALSGYLAENCAADEAAGRTAWDALVGGAAGSEGLAMALAAGCQQLGIPCRVVSGRLEGEPHAWNIVTIGEGSYHVDVSNWAAGEENVFLVGDEDLWGAYWWDTSEYPACPSGFGASGEASAEPASDEPAEETVTAAEIEDGILPEEAEAGGHDSGN